MNQDVLLCRRAAFFNKCLQLTMKGITKAKVAALFLLAEAKRYVFISVAP